MKKISLLLALCLLTAIASFPFLKKEFNGDNINISILEDEEELKLTADFPKNRSNEVQTAIENSLHLQGDISLENVEIKNYVSSDKSLKIDIKSESGYFKIVLDKSENSRDARNKIKELSEKIKGVLTEKKS